MMQEMGVMIRVDNCKTYQKESKVE
jgi:hypothetical protein